MVVDGNTSMLFYLGMLLKRLEYHVSTSRSAEEALRMMDETVPSLVLTDIALPRMNGINLLKRIKDTPKLTTVPVILITAENDPGMKDTCMRAGCAAYLGKPVEPGALYRAIQAATESLPRENIRLSTSLKVLVGDGTALGGGARTEYATALSEGGLYVRTLYPLPRNTLAPISIFVGDRRIGAKAAVLYTFSVGEGPFLEPGMGMKFVEISEGDREIIRDFIKEQLTSDLMTPAPDLNL
jgi:CheY-like chemotaxis protein